VLVLGWLTLNDIQRLVRERRVTQCEIQPTIQVMTGFNEADLRDPKELLTWLGLPVNDARSP
jgi:hypothetical protein